MKHKELEEVVAGEADTLRKYAERILSADDAEDIHQFRIGYKKLRAFLRLVHGGKAKDIPGALKQIYRAAGKVRDTQVHLAIILDWLEHDAHEGAVYPGVLKAELEEARNKLHDLIIGYPCQDLTKTLTKSLPERLGNDTITSYVHRQAQGFYESIKEGATDEELHTARKRIKDIIYNADYLRADKNDVLFLEQEEELKKLATLLGDYHDIHMLISRLGVLPEGKISIEEKESLQCLERKLDREKDTLKTSARKALHELAAKAPQSLTTMQQAGLLAGSAVAVGLAVYFLRHTGKKHM